MSCSTTKKADPRAAIVSAGMMLEFLGESDAASRVREAVEKSEYMKMFRTRLFSRIVPTVKDIGLWGPRVRKAYEDMGVMEFAQVDALAILENDAKVADEFDAKMFVEKALGAS